MVSSQVCIIRSVCDGTDHYTDSCRILLKHVGYRTLFPYAAIFSFAAFCTMLMVKHGDTKVEAKRGLEAFDIED